LSKHPGAEVEEQLTTPCRIIFFKTKMRKAKPKKRVILPDPVYNDQKVSKFVNHLMYDGKKSIAFDIFYTALEIVGKKIQQEVSTGTSLTVAMNNANVFPNMVLQMASIGEESGSLDSMLGKSADVYEREVDDAVEGLSSLMEPLIMVVLGTLIGGLVVAMYLPIFKLGQVV